ncbi:MAG: hypothetical protein ACR2GL_02990 [Thermoleophilaceae bacterium]
MKPIAKLPAFVALLALTFGLAALAPAAIDPTAAGETSGSNHAPPRAGTGPAAGGLAVSAGGFSLSPSRTILTAAHGRGGAGTAPGAGEIPFAATFPTPGRYRLFLQFRAGGAVRTVDYTLEVPR